MPFGFCEIPNVKWQKCPIRRENSVKIMCKRNHRFVLSFAFGWLGHDTTSIWLCKANTKIFLTFYSINTTKIDIVIRTCKELHWNSSTIWNSNWGGLLKKLMNFLFFFEFCGKEISLAFIINFTQQFWFRFSIFQAQ